VPWRKYDTVGEATDDSIIRRMHIACYVTEATEIHSEHVTLNCLFHGNSGYADAPDCYVVRTLPVLLLLLLLLLLF